MPKKRIYNDQERHDRQLERAKKWQKNNMDKVLEYQRKRRMEMQLALKPTDEEIKERQAFMYRRARELGKLYYKKNKESCLQRTKSWKAKHPEKYKIYAIRKSIKTKYAIYLVLQNKVDLTESQKILLSEYKERFGDMTLNEVFLNEMPLNIDKVERKRLIGG